MRLVKLSYKSPQWELIDLELDEVNLIVGKNGTGKSKTIITLQLLIKLISQKLEWCPGSVWSLSFLNSEGKTVEYNFTIVESGNDKIVDSEQLSVDGQPVLDRKNADNATIRNAVSSKLEPLHPPKNKLVLHTNRDVKKFPFFEELSRWADESYGLMFANINSYSATSHPEFFYSGLGEYTIPGLFKSLSSSSRDKIARELNSIGYAVAKIEVIEHLEATGLFISEKDVETRIFHFQLSQGMFRALSIITYFEYLISRRYPLMVLIDDLCEGLDYERATKLGRLIFDKCLASNIQLVATSNDSFLMDVVDIKYWNVLQRKGKTVTAINIKNHPKIFEDFRFTGLSNFDFFSSDFLNQALAS